MFHLKVSITNAFTGLTGYLETKGKDISVLGMTIEQNVEMCRKFHPDCFVNFYWNDNKDFIFCQPLNMELDEKLVDEGKMLMDEFICKWYPELGPWSDIHGTLSN